MHRQVLEFTCLSFDVAHGMTRTPALCPYQAQCNSVWVKIKWNKWVNVLCKAYKMLAVTGYTLPHLNLGAPAWCRYRPPGDTTVRMCWDRKEQNTSSVNGGNSNSYFRGHLPAFCLWLAPDRLPYSWGISPRWAVVGRPLPLPAGLTTSNYTCWPRTLAPTWGSAKSALLPRTLDLRCMIQRSWRIYLAAAAVVAVRGLPGSGRSPF